MKDILCGVDLGGSKLSAGLFLPDGTLLEKRLVRNHVLKDEEGISASIIELIRDLLRTQNIDEEQLAGIGIGVAGHVNFHKGLVITASNFNVPFRNYPLRTRIAASFNVPVFLDNDANVQALAELKFGNNGHYSNIVFVTISTGVGCGIIIDRKLVRGMTGTAGEIGHTIIDPHSDIQCTCGNYGCLMTLSSGKSLPVLYGKYLSRGWVSAIGLKSDNVGELDGVLIKKGFDSGDRISSEVLKDSAEAIGTGLYNLFQILNPEVFIIGGGLINIGDFYLEQIKKKYFSLVKNMMYDRVEFKTPSHGNNTGLLGAAALILEERNE